MNEHLLEGLYQATEQNLQYGIGLLAVEDRPPVPIVQILCRDRQNASRDHHD